MKGFYIHVTNNLIDPKHKKAIGVAVWEFMWCLDKMTKVDTEKGTGLVLGGKPITWKEIAEELGDHEKTVGINMRKLSEEKYIQLKRTPRGNIITVNKAKKVFGKSDVTKTLPRSNENVTSIGSNENVTSNKDSNSIDNTRTTQYGIPRKFKLFATDIKQIDILEREFPHLNVRQRLKHYLDWIARKDAIPRGSPNKIFRKWLAEDNKQAKTKHKFSNDATDL